MKKQKEKEETMSLLDTINRITNVYLVYGNDLDKFTGEKGFGKALESSIMWLSLLKKLADKEEIVLEEKK